MSAYIPTFRTKDPDDVEPRNVAWSRKLARLSNPAVVAFEVFVDGGDGALLISEVAYDTVSKRISFTWSGGTLGQVYLVTCRLTLAPDWQIDQSGYVTIATH